MPKFTIETTFDVPHYRQHVYEAETLEAALEMAREDDNWDDQKDDFDCSGPDRITGAWEGEEAYAEGKALPFPPDPETLLRNAAPDMLEALKLCVVQLAKARTKKLNYDLELANAAATAAIVKAEGRANG